METSRRCEICNFDVHRASYAKQLRSKKHSEKLGQNYIKTPEWLFREKQAPIKNTFKNIYNPKTLKQIARDNFLLNKKKLNKEFVKKVFYP